MTLVREAVDARVRASDEEAEVDEVWCVFDVEWPRNHPGLPEAVQLAREHQVELAISNPCFELWLVLHFRDWTRWLDTKQARRLRRDCDRQPDKGLDGAAYLPPRGEAARRARRLEERHRRDGTVFPDDNPSSGMYRLLAAVEPSTAAAGARGRGGPDTAGSGDGRR